MEQECKPCFWKRKWQWVKDKLNKAFLHFLKTLQNPQHLIKLAIETAFFANFQVPENPIIIFGFTTIFTTFVKKFEPNTIWCIKIMFYAEILS